MPTFFQRPENALKRANEFIDVGKKQRALDALYDVIKSKKHRTWQKIHEPIMEKYLELCVELKKSHVAKEGLYQYKNICQQVNIKSLEDVVRRYLALAEEKTEEARKASHQAVVDVDDLDVIQQPENLLLSAVSGEDTQDRTDRAILTPWVKFLWESYRQCLDLLRNNSSVEKLYQDIAQQAFKFCLKYARKTEFRKLCDNLRTHLGHIYKHQHQQRAINLNNPESQAMHLETRLVQLDSAIQMELWQEAFKAVEDIHGLIALSKKPPKPSLMANYYQKLGLVFWKSGCHMFHACAWHRLFHLSREQRKNLSADELARLASRVLCATLAIPIPASRNQVERVLDMDETTLEKQRRLATLLGLNNPPNRAALIKDLSKYNIVQHVHPEIASLFKWLEQDFHPLTLSKRVEESIEFIKTKEDLIQYIPALQDITVTRLIKQVSQVYQTIEFSRLAALAPFASNFYLERIIVNSAKKLDLQVRIDHRTKSLSFGTDLGVAQKEDVAEGPYLQSMPSENIRNQLTNLSAALEKAVNIIQPHELNVKREEVRASIVQRYKQTAKKDHENILKRRQIIEERKEEIENLNVKREREEVEQAEAARLERHRAEMLRLEREAQERARQRRLEEHKEIQMKAAKEKLEQLRSTELGAKVFKDMDEENLAELDPDEIVARQVSQLEKEKKEMQEKLRQQEKKIDYLERAKRTEEIPLLEKYAAKEMEEASSFWEQQETERVAKMKTDRELALEHRDRLKRMMVDKEGFVSQLQDSRMSVYKEKLNEFEKKLTEERKKRLAERKDRRKVERRDKWMKQKQEEEQRRIDEEMIRQREEEEREERERKEAEEREYEEHRRKLEEIAEKQRQREAEIEERLRKSRDESSMKVRGEDSWRKREERGEREDRDRAREGPDDGDKDGDSEDKRRWKPATGGGGWREREKAREESWKRPDAEDDRGAWRSRDSGRDERGPRDRDDRGPRDREDRGPRDEGDSWRKRGDDGGSRDLRGRDDRGPREDRFGDAPRDRFGERGGGSSWRREETGRGFRDDRDGASDWRRGGAGGREERGGRDERGGREDRDDWRRGGGVGGRDDRGPPPRERDRDERPSWRERSAAASRDVRLDDPGGPSWRRAGAPAAGGAGGGSTDQPKEEKEDTWRRGAPRDEPNEREDSAGKEREDPVFDDRPSWKERQAANSRDVRLDEGMEKTWRKREEEKKAAQAAAAAAEVVAVVKDPEPEDDGWTTVVKR